MKNYGNAMPMKLQRILPLFILGLCVLLGLMVIFAAIVMTRPDLFIFSSEFTNKSLSIFTGILALATLLLALVAYLTINNSNEQENRHRQDQMARESRDRRERLLNEILEWATEIHTVSLRTDLPRIDQSVELHIEEIAEGNQEIIKGTKRNIVNKEHQRIEVETLLNIVSLLQEPFILEN